MTQVGSKYEKTGGRKSRWTVPLNAHKAPPLFSGNMMGVKMNIYFGIKGRYERESQQC